MNPHQEASRMDRIKRMGIGVCWHCGRRLAPTKHATVYVDNLPRKVHVSCKPKVIEEHKAFVGEDPISQKLKEAIFE